MNAADKYLIKAQKSDYAENSDDFKVYFRSTLEGARGLAQNLLRKLGDGHEVCIFDLTLHEIVNAPKPRSNHFTDADIDRGHFPRRITTDGRAL